MKKVAQMISLIILLPNLAFGVIGALPRHMNDPAERLATRVYGGLVRDLVANQPRAAELTPLIQTLMNNHYMVIAVKDETSLLLLRRVGPGPTIANGNLYQSGGEVEISVAQWTQQPRAVAPTFLKKLRSKYKDLNPKVDRRDSYVGSGNLFIHSLRLPLHTANLRTIVDEALQHFKEYESRQ